MKSFPQSIWCVLRPLRRVSTHSFETSVRRIPQRMQIGERAMAMSTLSASASARYERLHLSRSAPVRTEVPRGEDDYAASWRASSG